MQTLLSKLDVKTCQNQTKFCKKSKVQALCVDPNCNQNRNLCINCIKDHGHHSMIDYTQLVDLLVKEEKGNNEYKKLSLQISEQFNRLKSILQKELEIQEQKLKGLLIEIRTQYTTFDMLQQLVLSNSKVTQAQLNQLGTKLPAFLIEKQQGEREFYEIKQMQFDQTVQYLPIQTILSRLAYSTHYLTQREGDIQESLQIKPLDCYQQFTQLSNSLRFNQIYNQTQQSVQEQLRDTLISKVENLNCQFNKSMQQLKEINCSNWILNQCDQLQYQNIINLFKPTYEDPIQLDGHKNSIGAVAISSNEEYIVSGDRDGLIILWKLQNKEQVKYFKNECEIQDLSFSNDNKLLAAAQFNKPFQILIYDLSNINSNEPQIRLKGHTNTIQRIQFTQNSKNLISGSQDKTLKIWELSNSSIVSEKILSDQVKGVSISSNQQIISACCKNGQAYLFDSQSLAKLKQLVRWQAHEEQAFGTTFTPDSNFVLTSFQEIKLWSINQLLSDDVNKIPLKIFKGSTSFWSIKLLLNGQIMISNDGQVKIWNLKTDQLICQLDVPGGYQYAIDRNFGITQDLKYIITGGKNCKLKIYELKDK